MCLQSIYAQTNDSLSTNTPSNQNKEIVSLKEIDKLIKAKEYNKALSLLSDYMNSNPSDFDRAQNRVNKIIKQRLEYDYKAENLADTMKNNNDDDEKKMEIIVNLEEHEVNQTKTAIELTRQARKTLALRFYIDRYNKIMKAGYELVKAQQYNDAISKFQEGFDLKQNDSDKIYTAEVPDGIPVVYSEDITEPVEQYMQNIKKLIPDFYNLQLECQQAYEAFINSVKVKDFEATKAANDRVQKAFPKYANLRNKIQNEVKKLEDIDKIANERNPLLAGFSYITFTLGFVIGDENVAETGVLGTMDTFWNTRVENMKQELYALIHSDLQKIPKTLPIKDIRKKEKLIEEQKANTQTAITFSTLGADIQNLNNYIITSDDKKLCEDFKEYNTSMSFIHRFAQSMKDSLDGSKVLSDKNLIKYVEDIEDGEFIASKSFLTNHLAVAVRYEEIMEQSKIESYIQDEINRENEYFKIQDITNNPEKHSAFEVAQAINKKKIEKTAGIQLEDAVLDFKDVLEYQQELAKMNLNESKEKSRNLWGGIAKLFATNASNSVDDYQFLYERTQTLLNGIQIEVANKDLSFQLNLTDAQNQEKVDDEKTEIVVRKYPKEAKKIAEQIIKEAGAKNIDFKDWRNDIASGEKYRNILKDYDEGTKSLDSSIKTIDELISKCKRIITYTDSQLQIAQRAMNEANQNYERALSSLNSQNFSNARTYLAKSSQKYAETFNIQEASSQRTDADRRIKELSERIIREENELVIAEVRNLINEAQDSYYEGNLEYAEKRLVMAQNRWAVTNSEKNEEIESLLDLVSTARTLQIGRKIKITDPLYSDISQILSVANQLYENGEQLMKQNKKQEAISLLNQAKNKLEPMKLIYPLNEDAAFLRLKIEKLLDPKSFEEGFKKRIEEANSKKSGEKLALLQDLLKINPKYPGLAKQVENLEYDLGIRTRPVVTNTKNNAQNTQEAENLKHAQDIYAQANGIFAKAGNNQEQLLKASSLLDEIIRMYSRDRRSTIFRQATALKDRIQSRVGGTVVAVLSADDEANFQRAQNFVNKGNYYAANDILDKLWKNPAAQKTKKIIDLRTFVKNRL